MRTQHSFQTIEVKLVGLENRQSHIRVHLFRLQSPPAEPQTRRRRKQK